MRRSTGNNIQLSVDSLNTSEVKTLRGSRKKRINVFLDFPSTLYSTFLVSRSRTRLVFRLLLVFCCWKVTSFIYSSLQDTRTSESFTDTYESIQREVALPWIISSDIDEGYQDVPIALLSDGDRLSLLPPRYQRITLIAVWNGPTFKDYMQQFFYSAYLNRRYVDLLVIVRQKDHEECPTEFVLDKSLGTMENIKIVCLREIEWQEKHVDHLCSRNYGWSCSSIQRQQVLEEFRRRADRLNCEWKPLRGWVFKDFFLNPKNPLWAWIDVDTALGRFSNYPFDLLASLSFVTGFYTTPTMAFMAGQMTAFNMDDPHIASVWKRIRTLQTPESFALGKSVDLHPSFVGEEGFWSFKYMDSEEGMPGEFLSWALLADVHGQDYFPDRNVSYLVSANSIVRIDSIETFSQEAPPETQSPLLGLTTLYTDDIRGLISSTYEGYKAQATYIANQIPLKAGVDCEKKWIPLRYTHCIKSNLEKDLYKTYALLRLAGRAPNSVYHIQKKQSSLQVKAHRLIQTSERWFMHYQRLKKRKWFSFPTEVLDSSRIMHVQQDRVDIYTQDREEGNASILSSYFDSKLSRADL